MSLLNKLTLIGLLGFSFLSVPILNASRHGGISADLIGPFEIEKDNQEVHFSYVYDKNITACVHYAYGTHGIGYGFSKTSAPINVKANTPRSYGFYLDTRNYLTSDGIDILLSLIDYTTNNTLYKCEITLLPAGTESLNLNGTSSLDFVSKEIACTITNSNIYYYRCIYDFHNISSSFKENSLKLDFSNIDFEYDWLDRFIYEKAILNFDDINNVFPYIKTNKNNKKEIELSLIQEEQTISISLAKTMYFEKNTMQISDIWRNGFETTYDLLIPKNANTLLEEYVFDFTFFGIGANKMDVFFSINYEHVKNVLGSCSNSDFCIVGGIKA